MVRLIFLCFLQSLPGPPKITLDGDTFQIPINKRLCPDIDPNRDITFHLYTKDNISNAQTLKIGDDATLKASTINFKNPTVIFFHDFLELYTSNDAVKIKNYYLLLGPSNIILVDSQRLLAGPDYITASLNVGPIANYSAGFVEYLVQKGLNINNLQVIGQGLGAHIGGIVGKKMKRGKIDRITGLDPAGLFFNHLSSDKRLSKGDGKFVEVIHTNAGIFGIRSSSGDLDIWFNGGHFQPGCGPISSLKRKPLSPSEIIFCSHYQGWRFYVQALMYPGIYTAVSCENHRDYKKGKCNGRETTYVGAYVNKTARGNYYIDTGVSAVNV